MDFQKSQSAHSGEVPGTRRGIHSFPEDSLVGRLKLSRATGNTFATPGTLRTVPDKFLWSVTIRLNFRLNQFLNKLYVANVCSKSWGVTLKKKIVNWKRRFYSEISLLCSTEDLIFIFLFRVLSSWLRNRNNRR